MTTLAQTPTSPAAQSRSAAPFALLLALAAVWTEVALRLQMEWSSNPQYAYGWSVPFLAAYLFWRRWEHRPASQPPKSNRVALPVLLLSAAMLLPARIIATANPDWRLLAWGMALTVALISFCLLFLTGGVAWARHFAYPVLFFLVSVPWPAQLEQFVVQQLMRAVAGVDVELLNVFGIIAVQRGNVIELTNGLLGVEDACSGIRSLQSTFMLSLFFGEFYALTKLRRFALVLIGLALAFAFNLARTFILGWIAAHHGVAAISQWHDPAGFGVLSACFAALWLISMWLASGDVTPPAPGRNSPVATCTPIFVALIVWLGAIELANETWFRLRAGSTAVAPAWTVSWPNKGHDFRDVPIPEAATNLLRYSEGHSVAWNDDAGKRWTLFFFRWLPGRTAALFVKVHRPEICLPASGMVGVGAPKSELINVGGIALPTRSYRFDDNGVPLHVYYCYWDGTVFRNTDEMIQEDWTVAGRLRRVWRGQRERGAQTLEVAVWGYDDDDAANEQLKRQLALLVHS
ncbi:MAG: archaeosortase/exosortase family protein [Verrucomicrobiota bacterium]|nr:archaeosortase/exosortase family protein [Verrucomicrobiota bacterium]